MHKNDRHLISICLLALLFAISFFKDDFTPDFLNTPNAEFIKLQDNRFTSLFSHPVFWLTALIYSAAFVLLPYFILQVSTNKAYSNAIAMILLLVIGVEYIMIFTGISRLDTAIIPKVNRFYHSPIFTLFFLAAFTVHSRFNDNEKMP